MEPLPRMSLSYAPRLPWHRRRSSRRVAALIASLLVTAAAWRWGPTGWRHVRLLYWQRQCLAYVAPADQVVLDDDPIVAAALLKREGYRNLAGAGSPPVAGFVPRCWAEAMRATTGPPAGSVLFLHERTSPGGQRRLVILQLPGSGTPPLTGSGIPALIEPATLTAAPKFHNAVISADVDVSWPDLPRRSTRLFAGQADPADASHFVIRFQTGGLGGTIDGWLEDNDRLRFRVRTEKSAPALGSSMTATVRTDGPGLSFSGSILTHGPEAQLTFSGTAQSLNGHMQLNVVSMSATSSGRMLLKSGATPPPPPRLRDSSR